MREQNEQKMVEKPIMLLKEEFTKDIAGLINSSNLPLVIVEPILRDILNEVNMELKKQYLREKEEYEKLLNAEK